MPIIDIYIFIFANKDSSYFLISIVLYPYDFQILFIIYDILF